MRASSNKRKLQTIKSRRMHTIRELNEEWIISLWHAGEQYILSRKFAHISKKFRRIIPSQRVSHIRQKLCDRKSRSNFRSAIYNAIQASSKFSGFASLIFIPDRFSSLLVFFLLRCRSLASQRIFYDLK